LIPTLTRLIKSKMAQRKLRPPAAGLTDIRSIQSALMRCLEDCHGVTVQRLRHKISHTTSAQELWLLRNDAYQLISQQSSQTVAAERINNLISSFEGWVEPRQLVRIK
jgi:hypothetical protein